MSSLLFFLLLGSFTTVSGTNQECDTDSSDCGSENGNSDGLTNCKSAKHPAINVLYACTYNYIICSMCVCIKYIQTFQTHIDSGGNI